MLDIIDLVNPGYQKAVDTVGKAAKANKTTESTESAETDAKTDKKDETAPSGDAYVPEDKEAVKAEQEAKTYKPNMALVKQMKEEQAQIQTRFVNMVRDMLGKQGMTIAEGDGIWKTLAGGKFEVDEAAKKAAQEAIAEDGYWGVKQTSDRILSFATALTGGDPDKVDDMRAAFEKGYKQAEKKWGGNLPSICQQTYDAVLSGFDKMAEDAG